ncbi:MAG: hypothetical protein ACE5EF_07990, partial [Dehalococcoidia bacterium]
MNEQREPGWTRHCARCGSALPAHSESCTECGARWERPDLSPGEVGHTIDVLSAAREAGRIPQFPFEATRQALEKLRGAAPRPRDAGGRRPSAPQTAAPAATPSGPRPTKRPPSPSRARALASRAPDARPATPAGPPLADTLRSWAARRQADILLYLGAFLLTAAAVTFVAYQGEAVGDLWRFVIVTAYTGAFLTAGLLLPRWERIREAGPVFLALGAVLVPIDLFALRAATSGGDLPSDVAILIGSAACAALYLTLAARGYGRWYTVPAVPAAMLAWGALGSVVNVPGGWFGAWYEVPAGVAWLVSSAVDWKPIRFLRRGAVTTSFVALLYSLGALGFDEANEWVLPVTLGIITAALAGGLPLRRSILAFAVLPLAAAATTAAALQAATDLGWPWYALAFGFA